MKIGLDAGHGLKTPGKQTPDGIKEYELNDKVRDKEVAILKDYVDEIINVDNDEGNVDESLTSRRNMYINAKVDVFISNHHNANKGKWGKHTGIEVYVDKNATKEDLELAQLVHDKLAKYTGLKGRGVKRANFTVINQNKVTAILVEGGFMDSTIDHPIITSEKGQEAYARAVAESIIEYYGLKKKTQETNTVVAGVTVSHYTVKINSSDGFLNVRNEPNANSNINTVVKNGEVYTIVEESNGWGKLKSGTGWINLKYTTKNKVAATPKPQTAKVLFVGMKVKIKSSAKTYCTGQTIPDKLKNKFYTVKQIGTPAHKDGVLLKEIFSWVRRSDIEF